MLQVRVADRPKLPQVVFRLQTLVVHAEGPAKARQDDADLLFAGVLRPVIGRCANISYCGKARL